MRLLITGSTGFIGSHLAETLAKQNHDVLCLERYVAGRQFEGSHRRVTYADLNDHATIKTIIMKEQPEIIVHLAALSPVAYSYTHWSEVLNTNFVATANLAEVCRQHDKSLKQFLFAGTSEEYGQQSSFPIKESAELNPNSPYAVSKVAADKYLRMMREAYEFPITIMRPFNTYGRTDNVHFITEKIISQMLNSNEIELGSSSPIRDFIHVDDHVNGYVKAIDNENAVNQAFNICSGEGMSIKDYVNKIAELMDWHGKVTYNTIPTRSNDINCLVGDNGNAKAVLGWRQTVSLEQGLTETIEKLKEQKMNGVKK
jgi:nucleoside-diphosphate-sugar epimerase